MNLAVVDEAIDFISRKILTEPKNCRPKHGDTISVRVEFGLNFPMIRGGWWNTIANGKVWIRYHWDLQLHNICPKWFGINHVEENCEYFAHKLWLDRLTVEEYGNSRPLD